jgi:hypothetical protein
LYEGCFSTRVSIAVFAALAIGCSGWATAQDNRRIPLPNEEQGSNERILQDDLRTEDELAFPPLPRDKALYEFAAGSDTTKLRYFIDLDSVSVGRDEVVRYVVVLKSGRANNVYYEGISCKDRAYKTYGFASSAAKRFRPFSNPTWRPMRPKGNMNFRWVMYWDYVCDDSGQPLGQEGTKKRIAERAFKSEYQW